MTEQAEHRKGTPENPLTQKDVLRRIQRNGGTAKDLDLSYAYLCNADLSGLNLEYANLEGARLYQANLGAAKLQGATLLAANLQQANLVLAKLQKANLSMTNLESVLLWGCQWQEAEGLENAIWGNHLLGEEERGSYGEAASLYRELKTWHSQRGLSDRAGEFFYREMECRRKGTSVRRNLGQWLWLNLLWGPLGYGEKPGRVVGYGLLVWLLFAAAYFAAGVFWSLVTPDLLFALYLSAVSFTAVGYGPWIAANAAQGWVQGLAAFESFVGVFMIAVFVTTFVRKMTR